MISIEADLTSNAQFYDLPFTDANLNTSALTATAGLAWAQNKTFFGNSMQQRLSARQILMISVKFLILSQVL